MFGVEIIVPCLSKEASYTFSGMVYLASFCRLASVSLPPQWETKDTTWLVSDPRKGDIPVPILSEATEVFMVSESYIRKVLTMRTEETEKREYCIVLERLQSQPTEIFLINQAGKIPLCQNPDHVDLADGRGPIQHP